MGRSYHQNWVPSENLSFGPCHEINAKLRKSNIQANSITKLIVVRFESLGFQGLVFSLEFISCVLNL